MPTLGHINICSFRCATAFSPTLVGLFLARSYVQSRQNLPFREPESREEGFDREPLPLHKDDASTTDLALCEGGESRG
jgi:hypothetical protein